MNRDRSTLVKSSSNNGITVKTKNKKSISDNDFMPNSVKRLGVSDRKVLSSQLRIQEAHKTRSKPPPRPRPGQKKFLTSVLTILSKSTTGTQYPDIKEHNIKSNKTKSRFRHETDTKAEKTNKQNKYKSSILNRNDKDDQFIVLQSMKEIAQTPSNYSEANTVIDIQTYKPKKLSIRDILDNNVYSGVAEGLARNVLEDKTFDKEKKLRIKDEPETLASKLTEEGDKKLYNLFVDILESTFNEYNLKEGALSESNTALEINESVAKKLTIKNNESHDTLITTNKVPTTKEQQKIFNKPIDIKLSDHKPLELIKPISTKSFVHTKKVDIPQKNNFQSKRKTIKNYRKINLLNIFKEELQLKPTFEEPLNLYQALKVMAKNKKIKNINENTKHLKKYFNDSECILRRRKIISMKTKKVTKTHDRIVQKYSEYNSKLKKRETTVIPSYHSLKVYEYNYEDTEKQENIHKKHYKLHKNLAKSSPFPMKSSLDFYTLLKFPDRSTYDFTY